MLISLKPRPVKNGKKNPSANFGENRNLAPRKRLRLNRNRPNSRPRIPTHSLGQINYNPAFLPFRFRQIMDLSRSIGFPFNLPLQLTYFILGLVETKKRSIPPNVLFSSQGLSLHHLRRRLTHFEHLNYQLLQKKQSSRLLICLRSV